MIVMITVRTNDIHVKRQPHEEAHYSDNNNEGYDNDFHGDAAAANNGDDGRDDDDEKNDGDDDADYFHSHTKNETKQ